MTARSSLPAPALHAGADTIDYQKPYKAAGLDKAIPWYQAIGNHDQYWSGIGYENAKLRQAHVGSTILNINRNILADPNYINETGAYMGVVDGSTPYGNVIGAGPEKNFPMPPTVVADPNRHSLVTSDSTSRNWMREFFTTTSNPVGHGFTQANLDKDFACYSLRAQVGSAASRSSCSTIRTSRTTSWEARSIAAPAVSTRPGSTG